MDVIVLFMKLEDKYWGIFLVALFFLYVVWLEKRKINRSRRWPFMFAVYGLVSYLVFLSPLTYRAVQKFVPSLSGYYELSHVQLVVPILAVAGTTALLIVNQESRKRAACLLVGLALLLVAAGDFAYFSPEKSGWKATCNKEEEQVLDMILAHADATGEDGKLRVWGMEKLMAKSRLYNEAFQPIYGKDMGDNPGGYSEQLQIMYRNYSAYDRGDGSSINLGDQLDALACFPYLYEDVDCEYMILHAPEYQFEDYTEFYGKKGFDIEERVCGLGYELVGKTNTMFVFYRQEGR